jgi:hypothetical protein
METVMPPDESSQANEHPVSITINDEPFKIGVPITGAQLRVLGNIPEANQLFEERHGQDPDVLIDPGASYEPKPGTHYYDLPRGTVGAVGLDEQIAHAVDQLPGAERDRQPDGSHLLRWRTQAPSGWHPREVTLLIVVPPAYPGQAPSGFDSLGPMTQNDVVPPGSGARELAGMNLTHFCWNPAGEIDYAALDGLWRFAKFSEKRFLS